MSSVNKVILIGRVGQDPEIRYLNSGKAVTNISLATTSKRKSEGGYSEDTQWHRITMYDKLAEIAGQYVRKGSMIYVEGTLKYGKFTDKNGVEKNTTDIMANQMQMLGGKSDGQREERRNNENEQQRQQSFDEDDGDVPF